MLTNGNDPIVRGGQGRSDESVQRDGFSLLWLFALFVMAWSVVYLVARVVGAWL